jgi:RHS repeat-associated protein
MICKSDLTDPATNCRISGAQNMIYDYANKPHAVRSAGSIALLYDGNGNMTSKIVNQGPGMTLSEIRWNEDNKPSSITTSTGTVTFTYDGDGDRVKKTRGTNTTYYFGDAYEIRNGVGIIHLFANGKRFASIRSDGDQYYHGNHLGSASVITDQNGDQKETIEYYPFGSYRARSTSQPFPKVNYTFTDQEDDDETDLYNYDARFYDPQIGRFISADSIVPEPGDLQAFNRYSYCVNNPLIYTDPSGHDPSWTWGSNGNSQSELWMNSSFNWSFLDRNSYSFSSTNTNNYALYNQAIYGNIGTYTKQPTLLDYVNNKNITSTVNKFFFFDVRDTGRAIADTAYADLGNRNYAQWRPNSGVHGDILGDITGGIGAYKCNIWLDDILGYNGIVAWKQDHTRPSARDWFDSNVQISNCLVVKPGQKNNTGRCYCCAH